MGTGRAAEINLLLVPLLFLCLDAHASAASSVDTISRGRPLSGDRTIVSRNGRFELGFFSPGKYRNFYVGIWYKREPRETVVWVANRDRPATGASELAISQQGNLVLTMSGYQVWSSNARVKNPNNSRVAVLQDDGNLVLADPMNPSAVLWQSFDNPTDTWLPGAWVGFDKAKGKEWALTSWRSPNDPAPGNPSFRIDENITKDSVLNWKRRRGFDWRGQACDILGYVAPVDTSSTGFCNFSCSYSENSSYYSSYSVKDSSINARVTVDSRGITNMWLQGPQLGWTLLSSDDWGQTNACPECGLFSACEMNRCGCLRGFVPSTLFSTDESLCMRSLPLQCGNTSSPDRGSDTFYLVQGIEYPYQAEYLTNATAAECKLACLNNCSCTAYSYDVVCLVWNGPLVNLKCRRHSCAGNSLNIRVGTLDLQTSHSKKSNARIVIGVVAGCAALLFLTILVVWRLQSRSSQANGTWEENEGSLVSYSYKNLRAVTKNFSEKLGRGGFGSVYKGTLPNSDVVAVKTLERLGQGEKQFRTEVSTIGMIQHTNLVRLLGFCADGSKRSLVYEYMANGSLDSHLFGKKVGAGPKILDWKARYQIALGTARGLAYLHAECRDCIIHCDIKPENILLDADFSPKVSDFGLAKLVGREFGRALTTLRGTIGYLAPEWISGAPITEKADVYSFGMMLFEIISGKRNGEKSGEGEFVYFPIWVARKIHEGNVLCLVDSRLEGNVNVDELARACGVACWCIQDSELHRPSMPQVVLMLEGALMVEMPPIPRVLQNLVEHEGRIQFALSFPEQSNTSYGSETEGSVPPSYI